MDHRQAIEALADGLVLQDRDGVQWRQTFSGIYEAKCEQMGMPDWRPFGRDPLESDAPFEEVQ